MKRIKVLLGLIFVVGLATTGYAFAIPSAGFQDINGEIFDDWQICRTRAFGEDGFYQISETGFRPVIAAESLGENAGLAYNLGQQFVHQYPDEVQRAEEIFYFVRDRVQYTPDVDQFKYDGLSHYKSQGLKGFIRLSENYWKNGVNYYPPNQQKSLLDKETTWKFII